MPNQTPKSRTYRKREARLASPLELPCGQILPNRIVKGAMTERIAASDHEPHDGHLRVYARWAGTDAGLLITGNVMIDRDHLEAPGNIVADSQSTLSSFQRWAQAAQSPASQVWMQLSHPGRQSPSVINAQPVSASEIPARDLNYFTIPRALEHSGINDIVWRFGQAAAFAKAAGFNGVQLHAAYGYLLSSFLSPRANKRTDSWGGTPDNRRRLLLKAVRAVREAVGPDFAVSVKINCSDYIPGGLTQREALETISCLHKEKLDLVDLSGGSFDKSISFATKYKKPTDERLFIGMARAVKKIVPGLPVMVTGNLRSGAFMEHQLKTGAIDAIGLGRPFLIDLDFSHRLLEGSPERVREPNFVFDTDREDEKVTIEICWYYEQLHRLSLGQELDPSLTLSDGVASVFGREARLAEAVMQRRQDSKD